MRLLLLLPQQASITTDQLAVATVILENVIFLTGEDYLLNHIKLWMTSNAENLIDGNQTDVVAANETMADSPTYVAGAINSALHRCLCIGHDRSGNSLENPRSNAEILLLMDLLKLFFGVLLHFHKLPITMECFKRNYLNKHLIGKAVALPKQILLMSTVSDVLIEAETEIRSVVHVFNNFLLSIDCEREMWLAGIECLAEYRCNHQLLAELLAGLCGKYVSSIFTRAL